MTDLNRQKNQLHSYARYSSIALQMLIIILLGALAGYWLDSKLHTKPILIVILTVASVIMAIYLVTKDLLRSTGKHDKTSHKT